MKKIVLIIYILGMTLNAQNPKNPDLQSSERLEIPINKQVKVKLKTGVENEDLQIFYQFENIYQYEFQLNGPSVKNKFYILKLKEFKNGKLINIQTLFDESNNDYFKTDSTSISFKLFTKLGQEKLKIWLRGRTFGSKKSYFDLEEKNKFRYKVKDFIGGRESIIKNINKPFYLLAVITPYLTESGGGSYCKVAYSDINPEEFGKEFDIPHYFLIEMKFVK